MWQDETSIKKALAFDRQTRRAMAVSPRAYQDRCPCALPLLHAMVLIAATPDEWRDSRGIK